MILHPEAITHRSTSYNSKYGQKLLAGKARLNYLSFRQLVKREFADE